MMITDKIRRLSEMDAQEIRFRIAQKLRIKREQWQLAFDGNQLGNTKWWHHWDTKKVTDPELRSALQAGDRERASSLLPGYFADRIGPTFYLDVSERARIVKEFANHFGSGVERIRADAEAMSAHRFHIFAYPEVSCAERIPWLRDLIHGAESHLDHYAHIPTLDFKTVGDSKNVWELNRHQHFVTLSQAYLLTGEERFAEECLLEWEDWIEQNPYLRGINWASSLEIAFRSWSWIWMIYLLLGSRALTGDRIGRITQTLSCNAKFIAENLSTYFAPNTHLLGEGFALFIIGLLFPELKNSEAWQHRGREILIEEMQKQVRVDGSHVEQSSFYHRYAVEFFLCGAIIADRNGCSFPETYRERLEKMLEFLAFTAWPCGSHPTIGDSDGGRLVPFGSFDAEDHRPVLSTGAVYFGRGDFRTTAGTVHEQTPWLLGADAARHFAALEPVVPSTTSRTFSDAGLVTMRTGWSEKARFLLFDAGPQGMRMSGHGHADALSLVCSANGVNWLVDPGTFVYTASRPWRDFFRSTPAHNTIAIDGVDQSVCVDWFKWRELPQIRLENSFSSELLDYATGSHTGYTRLNDPVSHRRRIIFSKPSHWLICDELIGRGSHRVNIFFHFGTGISVQAIEGGWLAMKGNKRFFLGTLPSNLRFRIAVGEEKPIQGWYSADYGHREPAPVLEAEIETAVPAHFYWLLCPVDSELPKFREVSGLGRSFVVERDGCADWVMLGQSAKGVTNQEFSTDAALSIVRRRGPNVIERFTLINGNSLWSQQRAILLAEKAFDHFTAEWTRNHLEINAKPLHNFRLQIPSVRQVRINGESATLREVEGGLEYRGDN